MAVEAAGPISALNPNWPLEADEVREGAAHIRVVKSTLQIQFPNLNAATPRTPDEFNALTGATAASPLQAQITALQDLVNSLDKPQVGDIKFSGNGTPSADWTACDGSERTRGDALWSVIGTTFGEGDGSSTYNVPDFRGTGPKGTGNLDGNSAKPYPVGEKGGLDEVTLTKSQLPSDVMIRDPNRRETAGDGNIQVADDENIPLGGGLPHENRSPYLVCHVYIRFRVTAP